MLKKRLEKITLVIENNDSSNNTVYNVCRWCVAVNRMNDARNKPRGVTVSDNDISQHLLSCPAPFASFCFALHLCMAHLSKTAYYLNNLLGKVHSMYRCAETEQSWKFTVRQSWKG